MEPQPDFEALRDEFDQKLPRMTVRGVIRAFLDGASRAFVLFPPERGPRLSRERYEEILQEMDAIDASEQARRDLIEQSEPIEKEE